MGPRGDDEYDRFAVVYSGYGRRNGSGLHGMAFSGALPLDDGNGLALRPAKL